MSEQADYSVLWLQALSVAHKLIEAGARIYCTKIEPVRPEPAERIRIHIDHLTAPAIEHLLNQERRVTYVRDNWRHQEATVGRADAIITWVEQVPDARLSNTVLPGSHRPTSPENHTSGASSSGGAA